jgi:hypothetical protein
VLAINHFSSRALETLSFAAIKIICTLSTWILPALAFSSNLGEYILLEEVIWHPMPKRIESGGCFPGAEL